MNLPYIKIVKTSWISGIFYYAVVLNGVKNRDTRWCHAETGGKPFWHISPKEAEGCFDTNHPGVREAIRYLEEDLRDNCNSLTRPQETELRMLRVDNERLLKIIQDQDKLIRACPECGDCK